MDNEVIMPRIVMDVPQTRVRILARAVSCLAKISDELFLEPSQGKVVLRAINSLRTVHIAVTFQAGFFTELLMDDCDQGLQAAEPNIRIPCRYFLGVFKSLPIITSVRMELGVERDRIRIRVHTVHEAIVKTYLLAYGVEQSDKAETEDMTGCRFRMRPNQLSDVLANFHAKCENIQFSPSEQRLTVASSGGSGVGLGGTTSSSLSVSDLISYEYEHVLQQGAKVCEQKYVKAFLNFSDICLWETTASFDEDRSPILLEAESPEVDQATAKPTCKAALLVSAWEADAPMPTPGVAANANVNAGMQGGGYPQQQQQQRQAPVPATPENQRLPGNVHTRIDSFGASINRMPQQQQQQYTGYPQQQQQQQQAYPPQQPQHHSQGLARDPAARLNMDAPVDEAPQHQYQQQQQQPYGGYPQQPQHQYETMQAPAAPGQPAEVLAVATPYKEGGARQEGFAGDAAAGGINLLDVADENPRKRQRGSGGAEAWGAPPPGAPSPPPPGMGYQQQEQQLQPQQDFEPMQIDGQAPGVDGLQGDAVPGHFPAEDAAPAAPKYSPPVDVDDDLLRQIGSWRPERYYSQVNVSQYHSQPLGQGLYRVVGEEEVLEPSISPPRE